MPIILDHHLREQIPHDCTSFPISFFADELATLPNNAGPLHWHPDFEIATALCSTLDFQIGLQHVSLHAGESIFINGNVLHGIRQISDGAPDPMPNIVFSPAAVAHESSIIYRRYIQPIAHSNSLHFIVFNEKDTWHADVTRSAMTIYRLMQERPTLYEMAVQRELCSILEHIAAHLSALPRASSSRVQITSQIRLHKMLAYIHKRYAEPITLQNIAEAACISRSEAGRCFHAYMGCSPVDALIRYRLQMAHRLLKDTTRTLQDISYSCGFNSLTHFSRQFRKLFGIPPGKSRSLGK